MPYAIYLRKSRVDLEAEAHGEGDTLARHRKTLLALAAAQQLNVTHIYEEVVSGDTIAARPQMQQLLADVDEGLWEGVLVMEVERLARGDTIDQGIVAQAFKVTDTKIITPLKSYDPNNEFDEEYFEFGLFMARREYKVINRRLQRGRLASVKEGKWVGNTPPYGYRRVKLAQDKGFWLEPDPETAPVVRNIFHWYVEGRSDGTVIHPMGLQAICTKLNQSGIPSPSRQTWSASTLRDLLQNPVYCGLIRWGWRKQQKTYHKATGTWQATRSRAAFGEYPVYQGLHEPLVTRECWDAAQAKFATHPSRPGPKQMAQKNPLAGLCYCSVCGRAMVRRPYKSIPPQLICAYPTCPTKGSYLSMVEDAVLEALENTLNELRLGADPVGAAHRRSGDVGHGAGRPGEGVGTGAGPAEEALRLPGAWHLHRTGLFVPKRHPGSPPSGRPSADRPAHPAAGHHRPGGALPTRAGAQDPARAGHLPRLPVRARATRPAQDHPPAHRIRQNHRRTLPAIRYADHTLHALALICTLTDNPPEQNNSHHSSILRRFG